MSEDSGNDPHERHQFGMNRRRWTTHFGGGLAAGLAGCVGRDQEDTTSSADEDTPRLN